MNKSAAPVGAAWFEYTLNPIPGFNVLSRRNAPDVDAEFPVSPVGASFMELPVPALLIRIPLGLFVVSFCVIVRPATFPPEAIVVLMPPASLIVTVLFWISFPVVPSKRVIALSVADDGPTTSPEPLPDTVVQDNIPEPFVVKTCPLEPSTSGISYIAPPPALKSNRRRFFE